MKHIFPAIILFSIVIACSHKEKKTTQKKVVGIDSVTINKQLAQMVKSDQEIQFAHTPDESEEVRDSLYEEQIRIFKANTDTIKQMFETHGFLGIDKVGKQASHDFWLLVQHADHDIEFQEKVLHKMMHEVKNNNADAANYAYLTDRVLKNKGEKQLFGTQVKYIDDFWVIPQPLQDSVNVNTRRKEVGLSTIEEYLNDMMELHYQMNKAIYEQNGLDGPREYQLED